MLRGLYGFLGFGFRAYVRMCVWSVCTHPTPSLHSPKPPEQTQKLNLRALYAGMASSLLGQMPYGMLVYGSYEVYKDMLVDGCVAPALPSLYVHMYMCVYTSICPSTPPPLSLTLPPTTFTPTASPAWAKTPPPFWRP